MRDIGGGKKGKIKWTREEMRFCSKNRKTRVLGGKRKRLVEEKETKKAILYLNESKYEIGVRRERKTYNAVRPRP